MLPQFSEFIGQHSLCQATDRILLAISGGMDSMVMATLFHRAGFRFGVAHANFQLRGMESDEDQRFVSDFAARHKVPFFTKRFFTTEWAETHRVSVQMAARELRYDWFEEICTREGYDRVATAHHQDDQVETFFINLLRGTGISGLHGIPLTHGRIIRPLLFATRHEIETYARTEHVPFREDSSNATHRYTRNRIRHELIPLLEAIHPDSTRNLRHTIERLRGTETIFRDHIDRERKKLLTGPEDHRILHIPELKKRSPLEVWLFELLRPFDFPEATVKDLVQSLERESGKVFFSPSFRIVKDRDDLILEPVNRDADKEEPAGYCLREGETLSTGSFTIQVRSRNRPAGYRILTSRNAVSLDKRNLRFPLELRHWNAGDYFYPFGLNKRKKLSDFFIDQKVSLPEKEKTWILCSGRRVAWVVGHRPDHRFRVTSRTSEVVEIRFSNTKKARE